MLFSFIAVILAVANIIAIPFLLANHAVLLDWCLWGSAWPTAALLHIAGMIDVPLSRLLPKPRQPKMLPKPSEPWPKA